MAGKWGCKESLPRPRAGVAGDAAADEELKKDLRLIKFADEASTIQPLECEGHRFVLAGAVAEAPEVVVQAANLQDTFLCGGHVFEGEYLFEKPRVDVGGLPVIAGARIEVEVSESPLLPENLADIGRPDVRRHDDLGHVLHAPVPEFEDPLLLRPCVAALGRGGL